MKVQLAVTSLSLGLIIGGLTTVAIYGQVKSATAAKSVSELTAGKRDEYVGVYISSVTRQIKMSDLAKAYPSNRAGVVDKAKMAADDLAGWYDRGNNYHEQKMENNLKVVDMGGLKVLPQLLRGQALRGEESSPAK